MPTIEELAADIDFLKRRASVPNSLPQPPPLSAFSTAMAARQEATRRRWAEQVRFEAERRQAEWNRDAPRRERVAREQAAIDAKIGEHQAAIIRLHAERAKVR